MTLDEVRENPREAGHLVLEANRELVAEPGKETKSAEEDQSDASESR